MMLLLVMPHLADARGRSSSRSFSSSRSRSSSSSSFFSRSSRKSPSSSRSYRSKTATKKKTVKSSSGRSYGRKSTNVSKAASKSRVNRNIGIKKAKVNSKLSLNKFKTKSNPKTTPSYKSVRSNNKVVGRIATRTSPTRLRTYHSRRETYYSSYRPPAYVYHSSSSFGAYDAMFLWMMLDRPTNHSSYYHHQRDPGFQEWRREANKQAATNAELRAKLAALDKSVVGMKGTKVDPSFVPAGMDADLMLSEQVITSLNKELTSINLATATHGNNYWNLGSLIKRNSDVTVNITTSAGSMENLKNLVAGKVDAAIVQADAFKVWKKENPGKTLVSQQAPLYREYVHILANRKGGVKEITDLTKKHTIYVAKDSGSEVTWKAFGIENSRYKNITMKYATPSEALLKVAGEPNSLMVFVSGLNSKFIKTANKYGDRVKLIKLDDNSLDDAVDQFGNKIYTFSIIPGSTYKKLQDGLILTKVKTLSVDAVLVLSNKWKKKQGQPAVENLTSTFAGVLPSFKKTVERNGLW